MFTIINLLFNLSDVGKLRLCSFCFMILVFLCGSMLSTTSRPYSETSIPSCHILRIFTTLTKRFILYVSLVSLLTSCIFFMYNLWISENGKVKTNFYVVLVSLLVAC